MNGSAAWLDPATSDGDVNHYANPPFRYCPADGCADPIACGQAMSCARCDASDRSAARRNGTFHELPICVSQAADAYIPPEPSDARPYYRWEGFYACDNPDGCTAHILVVTDSGGYIFADDFTDIDAAAWVAKVLNAALAAAGRRTALEMFKTSKTMFKTSKT